MKRFFLFLVFFIFFFGFYSRAKAQTLCTYFASPEGGGDGKELSSPFQISNFWPLAQPGDILCLLDGTYIGNTSMIRPPDGFFGTENQPITIKAFNEGKVIFDGQSQNYPILLINSSYIVIVGINAHHSRGNVYSIRGGSHNTIRRSTGWDAYDGNSKIFDISDSLNNLLEDVAGWGIARKTFSSSQGGDYTTIRRAWGSWDGSHYIGPKMTYTLAYNNYNMTVENAIGTWTGHDMKATYTLLCPEGLLDARCGQTYTNQEVFNPIGIFSTDHQDGDLNTHSRLLGSIAYILPGTKFGGRGLYFLDSKAAGLSFSNDAAYISSNDFPNVLGFYFRLPTTPLSTLTNITIISAKNYIDSDYPQQQVLLGTSLSQIYSIGESIYNSSRGAQICYRYKDGVLTTELLWPWPMNDRIRKARILSGRAEVDVTQTITNLFGPIAANCMKTRVFGDINDDQVTLEDNLWSLLHYAQTDISDREGDFNTDKKVNLLDSAFWQENQTQ